MFMMRNMKVAAVLKAESIEEESKTRENMRKFTLVYLPVYVFLSLADYILEIVLFQNKQKDERFELVVYILVNSVKLVCETFIGL